MIFLRHHQKNFLLRQISFLTLLFQSNLCFIRQNMNFLKKFFFSPEQQQPKLNNPIKQQQTKDSVPIQVLTQLFQKSAKYIAQTSTLISEENKLTIYGLYKQATIGDCNTQKPSMLDFVGKSKWNAWNSFIGLSKQQAMKLYIFKAVEFAPEIQMKMQNFFEGENQQEAQQSVKQVSSSAAQSTIGLKMVQQKDYSDSYTHPYFRLIEKNLPIEQYSLTRELLLKKNSNPKCYPLHFAIDKQRLDLVKEFISILTTEQINSMQDEDGTGIEEYAELIENEEIIELVKQKLKNS